MKIIVAGAQQILLYYYLKIAANTIFKSAGTALVAMAAGGCVLTTPQDLF